MKQIFLLRRTWSQANIRELVSREGVVELHARILGFRGLCLSDNDFCKALEINPMFLGGPDSEDFMKRMK